MVTVPQYLRIHWFLVAACVVVGCSRNDSQEEIAPLNYSPANNVANQPEQEITALPEAVQKKKAANQPEQKITELPEAVQKKKMANQPEQKITALTEADQKRLRDQRAVVEHYLRNEDSKKKYKTVAGKVGIIRAILQADVFKRNQTYELQCLGIILGDALVQEMGMEWIMVEDEYGRDPAIRMPKTTIIVFPMTMILKRVERGDKVDVFELFNGVAAQVEELQCQGK